MGHVIVVFDVVHIGCFGKCAIVTIINSFQPGQNERVVVGDAPHVAFEMTKIYRIKPNDCGEKPDISLGHLSTGRVGETFKDLLDTIQCFKNNPT